MTGDDTMAEQDPNTLVHTHVDENGNVIMSEAHTIDTTDCILYGTDRNRLIATLGVDDLVIAVTDDVVLVADKNRSQDVKLFVEGLSNTDKDKYL